MFDLIALIIVAIVLIHLYFKILFYGQDGNSSGAALLFTLMVAIINLTNLLSWNLLIIVGILFFVFIMNLLAFKLVNKFDIYNKFLYFILFEVSLAFIVFITYGILFFMQQLM